MNGAAECGLLSIASSLPAGFAPRAMRAGVVSREWQQRFAFRDNSRRARTLLRTCTRCRRIVQVAHDLDLSIAEGVQSAEPPAVGSAGLMRWARLSTAAPCGLVAEQLKPPPPPTRNADSGALT